jgi:Ca2+-binding RTX toxin-like protein
MPTRPIAFTELLEPRRLLSSVALTGATLRIAGDDVGAGPDNGEDRILITRDNSGTDRYIVRVNGEVTRWRVRDVRTIRISTRGGDDEIEISNETGTIEARRLITAGNGRDTITSTGGGGETLRGSSGNDLIRAADGSDIIEGNGGRDTLFGESGADQIFGGRGNDSLDGGAGNDSLYGDAGDDDLSGNAGRDILAGDSEDTLTFEGDSATVTTGDDNLNGGADNDTLLAHRGDDTLTGGSGAADLFDPRGPNDASSITDRADDEIVASEQVFNGIAFGVRTITLRIVIDGEQVDIPEGAGHFSGGGGNSFAEAIDDDGTIRFRDLTDRTFHLSEFFQAWGFTFDSDHIGRFQETGSLQLRMTVNGSNNTQFEDYVIRNGNEVVITMT